MSACFAERTTLKGGKVNGNHMNPVNKSRAYPVKQAISARAVDEICVTWLYV